MSWLSPEAASFYFFFPFSSSFHSASNPNNMGWARMSPGATEMQAIVSHISVQRVQTKLTNIKPGLNDNQYITFFEKLLASKRQVKINTTRHLVLTPCVGYFLLGAQVGCGRHFFYLTFQKKKKSYSNVSHLLLAPIFLSVSFFQCSFS